MANSGMNSEQLKKLIREVPDFPKPGILFYDITTLLRDKTGFAQLIDLFSEHYIGKQVDLILGMEARGFIFGPALAYRLNAGFVPVRKPGKLPAATERGNTASVRQQRVGSAQGAIEHGQRVLIVMHRWPQEAAEATARLAATLGAQIAASVVELVSEGREKLKHECFRPTLRQVGRWRRRFTRMQSRNN
jgi:adenine phosphoribosyltransferase